jgi:hypothetical protein
MVLFGNFKSAINVGNGPLTEYTDPNDAGDRAGAVPTAFAYVAHLLANDTYILRAVDRSLLVDVRYLHLSWRSR